jgi:hypothetical protein
MMPATAYWIGINREDSTAAWTWLDGLGALLQLASNTPYAHWSWNMNAYTYDSTKATWGCVQVGAVLSGRVQCWLRVWHANPLLCCSDSRAATLLPVLDKAIVMNRDPRRRRARTWRTSCTWAPRPRQSSPPGQCTPR